MAKLSPTGCIKDDNDLSWERFNILLEKIDFEDEIGHLFVVDIMFDLKNATNRQLV